jgi:hypothetical protein
MTYAAVTLLTLVAGQPAPDYYPMASKNIRIPIEYKKDRKTIRRVELYVARGENVWYQEGVVTPDRDEFVYFAKDDGLYWFKMVIVDLKGNKEPVDLTTDPPDMKILVDTTRPVVRVTNARRNGQEVIVEWAVDDKFPNDAETKVSFRATANPNDYWRDVKLPDAKHGVRFPCGTNEGVTVKISAVDIAGNRSEATYDFPTANATAPPVTSMSPPMTGATAPPSPTDPGHGMQPAGGANTNPNTGAGGPIAPPKPPDLGPLPGVGPVTPPSGVTPTQPGTTVPVTPIQPAPGHTGAPTQPGTAQPLPTVDPSKPLPPAHMGATPAGGFTPERTNPTVELTRAQVIGFPRFDLGYDLEKRGPSGISRVDLWVTRDDGKSWHRWSQHDGKDGSVRVVLDVPNNQTLEGLYGFRLVPVSGAGLSEGAPRAGDAPDMRVVLDVTPPEIILFPPEADKSNPDTLVLQWKATDRNFGADPITLEWSEAPTGPWRPVVVGANETVLQTSGTTPPAVKRLPNTGQYAWQVPAGIPPKVYLKVTARDAAGNVREVVTKDPLLVDLTTPRAKINGIVPPVTPRP